MNNEPQQREEIDEQNSGIRSQLGRWWDQVRGRQDMGDEEEEGYEEAVPIRGLDHTATAAPRRDTFRVASLKGSITLTQISNFTETQKVADRLKAGEPQVVNLEKTSPEVAERLIDFLNGVTYALDGCVEKVAEGAYLFTPAHIAIHADSAEAAQPKHYFEKI
jgi:FtsZ-interacting cell division protein YlmF